MHCKIKSREEIKKIVERTREENPKLKIVTTNGAFDMLHAGHVQSLKDAKSLGDILIVALNSDSSIKKYKSLNRPIIPQEHRAELLANLEMVHYVTIFDETDASNILEAIKPDFHAKSLGSIPSIERETIEKNNGKVVLFDSVPGISTTDILKKIEDEVLSKHQGKN